MRQLAIAIILSVCTLPFSFGQEASEVELLFAFKMKPKQIETKALKGEEDAPELVREVAKAYADLSDEVVKMPYELEKAFRTPTAYGIDYESVAYYGLSREEGVLSLVMEAELKDYSVFKEAMSQDSKALFQEKDGYTEVYENKVFTDGKKLIIVNTNYLGSRYGKPSLVNNKEEAITTKSMKCTEEEYAKQIVIPIEERNFDTDVYHPYGYCGPYEDKAVDLSPEEAVIEATEAVEEAADAATEAVEVTEDTYERAVDAAEKLIEEAVEVDDYEIEEPKKWYYIEYYGEYILIDNLSISQLFFKNKKLDNSSSYSKFSSSKADQAYWIDNEQFISTYQEVIRKEMPRELRKLYNSNRLLSSMSSFQDNTSFGEVFFNNGQARWDTYTFGNAEFLSNAKKVTSNKVDKKLLKYLPASSPAYAGGGVDINEVFSQYESYLKKGFGSVPGFDTIAEQSYELLKVVIDEDALAKIVNGQVLVYVDGYYDFKKSYSDYVYDEDYNYVKKDTFRIEKRPSAYSFIGTDDSETWNRIAKILEQTGYVGKENGVYALYDRTNKFRSYSSRQPNEVGFYFVVLEDAVVFSSDKKGLQRITSGKTNKPSKTQLKNFKKYNTYANLNFGDLSDYLEASGWVTGSEPLKAIGELKGYENMELRGVQYGPGYVKTSLTINSNRENINILEHFIQSFKAVTEE